MVQWDVKNVKFSQPSLKDFLMDIQKPRLFMKPESLLMAAAARWVR